MFDYTRLTDAFGSLFSQPNGQDGGLWQQLAEIGIDAGQFEGMDVQQVTDALAENGVDLSSFNFEEIGQIADLTGGDMSAAELIARTARSGLPGTIGTSGNEAPRPRRAWSQRWASR